MGTNIHRTENKTRLSQVQEHIRINQDSREAGARTHWNKPLKITENGRGTLGNEVSIYAHLWHNQLFLSFGCVKNKEAQ